MDDSVAMQVLDACKNLGYVLGCLFLGEGPPLKYLLVEVAVAVLHNEVDLIPADVVAVGGEDVGMEAVEVDLHLVDQVVHLDLVLSEGLNGHQHPIDVGLGQDDVPRLALPQLLYHLQFVPGPTLHLLLLLGHLLEGLVHLLQLVGPLPLEVLAGDHGGGFG